MNELIDLINAQEKRQDRMEKAIKKISKIALGSYSHQMVLDILSGSANQE